MKTILCLLGAASALRMYGIDKDSMHNFEASDGVTNWRKPWP